MSQKQALLSLRGAERPPRCEWFSSIPTLSRKAAIDKYLSWPRLAGVSKWSSNRLRLPSTALSILLVVLILPSGLSAQQAGDKTVVDKQTLQILLQRIDQLEARVKQLESEKQATVVAGPASLSPGASPSTGEKKREEVAAESTSTDLPQTIPPPTVNSEVPQDEVSMGERVDLSKTLLRIRGFGDMSLEGSSEKGQTTSFSLGKLNLFVTSDVSERFKFLTEIVFEGGPFIRHRLRRLAHRGSIRQLPAEPGGGHENLAAAVRQRGAARSGCACVSDRENQTPPAFSDV